MSKMSEKSAEIEQNEQIKEIKEVESVKGKTNKEKVEFVFKSLKENKAILDEVIPNVKGLAKQKCNTVADRLDKDDGYLKEALNYISDNQYVDEFSELSPSEKKEAMELFRKAKHEKLFPSKNLKENRE